MNHNEREPDVQVNMLDSFLKAFYPMERRKNETPTDTAIRIIQELDPYGGGPSNWGDSPEDGW